MRWFRGILGAALTRSAHPSASYKAYEIHLGRKLAGRSVERFSRARGPCHLRPTGVQPSKRDVFFFFFLSFRELFVDNSMNSGLLLEARGDEGRTFSACTASGGRTIRAGGPKIASGLTDSAAAATLQRARFRVGGRDGRARGGGGTEAQGGPVAVLFRTGTEPSFTTALEVKWNPTVHEIRNKSQMSRDVLLSGVGSACANVLLPPIICLEDDGGVYGELS